jgi:cell division septum initiation protein DivIVA
MRRSDKQWRDGEPAGDPFLPDHDDDAGPLAVSRLRDRVERLEQQVGAQYTATAAYATLSQQGLDEARAEARADIDRTNATLLGLIDRLRAEVAGRLDALATGQAFAGGAVGGGAGVSAGAGGASADVTTRLAALEEHVIGVMRALEASVHENMVLRQQLADLQRKVMQADGWLVSGGGPSDLTMR